MERLNKVIRGGLGGAVGRMGMKRRRFRKVPVAAQRAVYLVRADLKILFARLPLPGAQIMPRFPAALQQVDGAEDIRGHKGLWMRDGPVHMGLRRKVDHVIGIVFRKQLQHQRPVPDVAPHENMARIMLCPLQVFQASRVGQGVQIDQSDIPMTGKHIMDKIAADKAGAASDQVGNHVQAPCERYGRLLSHSISSL